MLAAPVLSVVLPAPRALATCEQPVYIIAHRCNDDDDVPDVVAAHGVNAIEADFSWGDDRWAVEHDPLVIPTSTYIEDWLDGVNAVLDDPSSPLGLIILDIKDPDGPLLDLYNEVRGALGPDINLMFSIADFDDRGEFDKIEAAIAADPRAGVAIDYLVDDQTMSAVQNHFIGTGIGKYWLADGYNVTVETPESVEINVAEGMDIRDSENDCSAFHGVYTWTYEKQSTIKSFLDQGVNGIFINADECHVVWGAVDLWSAGQAVNYAKTLPGMKFAAPGDNPFAHVAPTFPCPEDRVVECAAPDGTPATDPQIFGFLTVHGADIGRCDDVDVDTDAPAFFTCDTTTSVIFTATDSGVCSPTSTCEASVTVQDTIAPLIDCPDDIAVDPQSPDGTVVTFAAASADVCDALPVVDCPDSGATFAIGSETQVTCTALDFSGNQALCSLQIKVYTPEEVVENLQAVVDGLAGSLNGGQLNSLHVQLAGILEALDNPNGNAACGKLGAFHTKVSAWVDNGILTAAEAQPLLQSTTNLLATLSC
ncbi:HYR domain-containing protein [Nannocystis punicea]|uniref:HYR domain-containing protein n=1 Tax=Nannocystis punicea TaxID=2995304 RepID=A0ABY7H1H9_9BACT|nr:HYR domain-containing protein [Nannocystis poenicansa]WAS93105.1 HYR domain-containing protein [Nannocystis poenicansa]